MNIRTCLALALLTLSASPLLIAQEGPQQDTVQTLGDLIKRKEQQLHRLSQEISQLKIKHAKKQTAQANEKLNAKQRNFDEDQKKAAEAQSKK